MEQVRSSPSIMSFEIPVIVTNFRDFELEERVVRILAHRGFRIGERNITGRREVLPGEILITDEAWSSAVIPLISIPRDARGWNEGVLERFLNDQILPPLDSGNARNITSSLLIIGGEGRSEVREKLLQYLHNFGVQTTFATFDDSDLRTALIPTRRVEERRRFERFARAHFALFLIDLEATFEHRVEVTRANSLIEYRRRVHPHLALGFALIGGRKSRRREVAATLEPFTSFWIDQPREEMLQLWSMKRVREGEKFREISEWIGSPHGDSREPSALPYRALTRGGSASR
jgi:hypothetical protein